jgi:plasmid stabilization system protein ParE
MARFQIRHRLAAVEELEKAADWYRAKDPRTMQRFLAAIGEKTADILSHPLSRPADEDGARLALLRPFPYCLVYRVQGSVVEIVAFAHTSREEGYWRNRLRES